MHGPFVSRRLSHPLLSSSPVSAAPSLKRRTATSARFQCACLCLDPNPLDCDLAEACLWAAAGS